MCVCVCVCVCVHMLVAQLCPTLCDPVDCNPSGFSIHGILQARILEWVAMPLSRGSSQSRNWSSVSKGRFITIWATREALSVCYNCTHTHTYRIAWDNYRFNISEILKRVNTYTKKLSIVYLKFRFLHLIWQPWLYLFTRVCPTFSTNSTR